MKKASKLDKGGENRLIQNRRARHDYEFIKTFEAGIMLVGSEVKSIYLGRAHLSDTYCQIKNDEAFLINFDVEPYEHSSVHSHERKRDRKLLLHKKEIEKLQIDGLQKGLALVPTKVYFSNGKVKVEIAIGRGRKNYDKREKIAEQDVQRQLSRELAARQRNFSD